jgi:iron complex transport system ATP-binding protein
MIRAKGIRFSYDRQEVLRGIDLEVPAGACFGLLGPNGSGKTTLIQILSGALRGSVGEVTVLGRELAAWGRAELARTVAVVPQRFDLAFPFTVAEVVLLGRVPHRRALELDSATDLAIAREAMEATEVTHLSGRRMTELSGGEFKRVLVAKALAGRVEEVMTYRHLKEVFEIDIYVGVNELTGHRLFSPMIHHPGGKTG